MKGFKKGKARKRPLSYVIAIAVAGSMLFGGAATAFADNVEPSTDSISLSGVDAYTTYDGTAAVKYVQKMDTTGKYYATAGGLFELKFANATAFDKEGMAASNFTAYRGQDSKAGAMDAAYNNNNDNFLVTARDMETTEYTVAITMKNLKSDPGMSVLIVQRYGGYMVDLLKKSNPNKSELLSLTSDVKISNPKVRFVYPVSIQTDGEGSIETKDITYNDADDTYKDSGSVKVATATSANIYALVGQKTTYTIKANSGKAIDKVYVATNGGQSTDVTAQLTNKNAGGTQATLDYSGLSSLASASDGYKVYATFKDSKTDYVHVEFDSQGGSHVPAIDVVKGEVIPTDKIPTGKQAPTKDGSNFEGWSAEKNGDTTYDFNTKLVEDTTLYAMWSAKEPGKTAGTSNENNTGEPKTGDDSNMAVLLVLMGVALAAGTTVIISFRKGRAESK